MITLDANIGAGKSTVLEYLQETKGIDISLEPVDAWQPYLHDMYHYGKGVFEFQVRVWLDRCWPKRTVKATIMERSPMFQMRVFITVNRELDKLTERQAQNLTDMYHKTMDLWHPEPYIYLRSSPERCAARILERGRETEADIPLSYLRRLHELHEATYEKARASGLSVFAVDVEGKTVQQIGEEIWAILQK